jgi:hypothetical protein
VGRHSGTIEPVSATVAVRVPFQRPRSRGRAALFTFAFTAAAAFVLVNIVDPYSGAVASPYFQLGDRFGGQPAQAIVLAGEYENTIVHDSFAAEAPAPPEPVVVEVAASAGWAPPAISPDPGSAQAYAQSAVQARGWGAGEFDCLVALWSRESGWRVNAYNASSGAYGIPQSLPGSKMSSAGADWETNAGTQIEWGLGYIGGRYGSPCGAWAHSEDAGWY